MNRAKIIVVIMAVLSIAVSCKNEDKLIYKDASAPIEDRVEDLLSRMTIEEKFGQVFMVPYQSSEGLEKYKDGVFGFQLNTSSSATQQILTYAEGGEAQQAAELANKVQKYFIEETRLGIPIISFDEALHGLVRKGATAYPQAIGLAATWDTTLVKNVAHSIATETRTRGIRQILSPVLNIARDVRWGRTEETYGEDTFLTTRMGVAFISEFEKMGVVTTPKHFVANVGDGGRDSYPIHFNERLLEEVYFPAYKAAFQEANAWSVMTSYNSYDGRPCTSNDWLLNQKLKKEWGFDGFVISDANAVGIIDMIHFTTTDFADAGKQSIENGLDVIFEVYYDQYKEKYYPAFERGDIDEEKLNEAVRRVLRAKFKLGLFENPYVDVEVAKTSNGTKEHRQIAKKAAQESIVLLKNEANTLPFTKQIKSVAVIGADATEARLGGYSGPGNDKVSILEGIQNKIGAAKVNYAEGCGRVSEEFVAIPTENLYTFDDSKKVQGLKGEYFNNINLEGEPALTRIDPVLNFRWTLFSPEHKTINYDWFSARWTGKLVAPKTGEFNIGLKGDDGYRLYIDGELVIDNWRKQTFQQLTKPYKFQKDKEYDIKVEFYETKGNVWFKLLWDVGVEDSWENDIKEAVAQAQKSDVAVVVVGINEGEFQDRAKLSLPGHQEEMIQQIAATGKPVTVVIVGGSAVTMNNWINEVPAIVDVWYPGDEGGNAVADVLFGDYNPAGRLPITFPIHEGQLPLYYNHKPTGRGDDYRDLTGKPLFPFGYGLSYSTFEYSDLIVDAKEITTEDSATFSFKVTNTGDYDGDEVVQLYIRDLIASVTRPVTELKGFQRIHLKKAETKEVTFTVTPEMLTMLDENMNRVVEPGEFRIMIGAASNDIRLREILTVKNE
ncbi:glycoside hydrolase family 3 C-terminal domain-containing protein [Flagellimonas sp. HMM57]|uniref:glycoside hydrolase family 3 protein n=1 Tax=unclassified Flagellimonas TaxID=2644544 RepID=UPI001969BFE6|nr:MULTISPECIES: glycoside hydrolase family 3 protein [unclassified Flagellimonas]UII74772.1 glycoside hydrolase family 3 C-terminal domain-containing protein [Flagellimonas sp. HMM57]